MISAHVVRPTGGRAIEATDDRVVEASDRDRVGRRRLGHETLAHESQQGPDGCGSARSPSGAGSARAGSRPPRRRPRSPGTGASGRVPPRRSRRGRGISARRSTRQAAPGDAARGSRRRLYDAGPGKSVRSARGAGRRRTRSAARVAASRSYRRPRGRAGCRRRSRRPAVRPAVPGSFSSISSHLMKWTWSALSRSRRAAAREPAPRRGPRDGLLVIGLERRRDARVQDRATVGHVDPIPKALVATTIRMSSRGSALHRRAPLPVEPSVVRQRLLPQLVRQPRGDLLGARAGARVDIAGRASSRGALEQDGHASRAAPGRATAKTGWAGRTRWHAQRLRRPSRRTDVGATCGRAVAWMPRSPRADMPRGVGQPEVVRLKSCPHCDTQFAPRRPRTADVDALEAPRRSRVMRTARRA